MASKTKSTKSKKCSSKPIRKGSWGSVKKVCKPTRLQTGKKKKPTYYA